MNGSPAGQVEIFEARGIVSVSEVEQSEFIVMVWILF